MDATETAFARAVERGAVPADAFGHRAHLRVAWVYLGEGPSEDAALGRMRTAVRQISVSAGKPDKYHETLTQFWMARLSEARAASPGARSLDEVLERHPHLLNKDLALVFYSPDRVMSDEARRAWVPPDRWPAGA